MTYTFKSKLDQWVDDGGWFYVSVPKKYYAELKEISLANRRGFGSIKVDAVFGHSKVETSIFPNNEDKNFIMFVKKSVRTNEGLELGSTVEVKITLKNI